MSNSCFIQYSVIYGRQGYKNKFLQVWLTASSAYLHIHRQYLQLVPNMQTKFKYLKNMHKLQLLQYKMMNCQYLYKSKLCWSQHQVPTSINAAIKFTLCQCWGSRFSWLPVFKCWSLYLGPYPNPYPPLKSWQFFLNFSFSSFMRLYQANIKLVTMTSKSILLKNSCNTKWPKKSAVSW